MIPPRKTFSLLLLLAFATPAISFAAETETTPKKEISDEVSSELGKLKEKIDAKDYAAALKLLDGILAKAAPQSYDTAMVAQIKGQILLTEGKYIEAVGPLSTALELGVKYDFYEKKVQLDQMYLLCQIHYQLASDSKDLATQKELYDKAYSYIRRWLDTSPKPTAEAQLFAASILYGHATLVPGKPDAELLRKARSEAMQGTYLAVKPPEQLYVILLASMQQLADHAATADTLENLVKQQPGNALYWQQLAGTYLSLSSESREDREIRRYQLRAVLTMERAQKHGHFKSPRDQMNIVGLYFNLEQYGKASDLLVDGLANGQIENTQANWELLALAYQQNAKEDRAVATLLKASDLFPKEGQIELTLAQMHYAAGRTSDAFAHLQKGAAKGNLKKPGAAYLFLGFVAYELQKYEDALRWAEAAANESDTKTEDARRLKRAAQDALREREALKNTKI